jgi:hypothetical protein
MVLKRRDPSMTEAINVANTIPKGNSGDPRGDWVAAAAFRAGVQKKTKRYIEPSKKQEARPRVKIRESLRTNFREDLAGMNVEAEERLASDSSWLSP